MSSAPVILWFRRNLRLADNPAVAAAVTSGSPVIPLYVLSRNESDAWDTGGASRWWLHHSLQALDQSLAELGGGLTLRSGNPADEIAKLARDTGARSMHSVSTFGPEACALQERLDSRLGEVLEMKLHHGDLLYQPGTVCNQAGGPYKVFTPFWKACLKLGDPAEPLPAPEKMRFGNGRLASDTLADWGLTPTDPDWAGSLRETWTPGEHGATERFANFVQRIAAYADDRDKPGRNATSQLSPHLHFGELSPRQVWHDLQNFCDVSAKGPAAYIRQLYWREFSYHLLHHFPDLPSRPLRPEFAKFRWRDDNAALKAWQSGNTGYPIVDAGMRELWATGWMHNRVRMLTASLLVKHLLIPWQTGAEWFRDTLVDADEANNSASWQWVTGCGTDAAPYFRIFNPVTQAEKFDPDGTYVRRWVPELAKLESVHIHAPWTAPADALRDAGITLGKDYPEPIVEHGVARQRALEAYRRIKEK